MLSIITHHLNFDLKIIISTENEYIDFYPKSMHIYYF